MKPHTSSSAIPNLLPGLPSPRARRRWLAWAIGLFAVIALVALLAWRLVPAPLQHGVVVQAPEHAYNFALTGGDGETVRLGDFRGQYVLLNFGYTSCPDVCPLTLSELSQAMEALGPRAERVQVLFVSVDAERDDPALVDRYAQHFHSSFRGTSGTVDELTNVATQYGVYFAEQPDSPFIDHTATVVVVDPKGYLRAVFPYGVSGAEIAADLERLMR